MGMTVVAFAWWSAAAFAATEVEKSCDVAPDCQVVIKNEAGNVQVQTWDQNRVELKGSLGDKITRLDFDGSGSHVNIEVVAPHRRHGLFSSFRPSIDDEKVESYLTISVPKGASLNVETISADAMFKGVAGAIEASTVSGDLTIEDAVNSVCADSVSGDVEVSANGPSATIKTISGDIEIAGKIDTIQADTVSGSINVSGNANHVATGTVSGNITAKGVIPDLKTDTVCGHVSVERATE